jgi:CheY-like chemotaxis protein
MRILVVEDEAEGRAFTVRQGLVEEGHVVEVAAGGEAALDAVTDARRTISSSST